MQDRLDGPSFAEDASMGSTVADVGTSLANGRYRLVEKLGEGGFGVAFKALETGTAVRRAVAIKILHSHVFAGSPAARARAAARFRAEVQLIANLDHPNIVHLYYDGAIGDRLFFVMEYLDKSKALSVILQEAEKAGAFVPLETVKDYFLQVAAGLRAVHQLPGVFHRDIKLDNLIVAEKPDGARIKIVDFGIAHNPELPMTQTGSILGTSHYLAPEMIACDKEGKALVLDHRVDLYALGVALYKFVTFRFPFDSVQASTSSFKAPPPSLFRAMPLSLERIILRLLEKDRDKRYPDAAALIEDLLAFDPKDPPVKTTLKSSEKLVEVHSKEQMLGDLPSLGEISDLRIVSAEMAAAAGELSSGDVNFADLDGSQLDAVDIGQEGRDYIRALHQTRPGNAKATKRLFEKQFSRRDLTLVCGSLLLFALLAAFGVNSLRKKPVESPAVAADVRGSQRERPAVSATDILHDARSSETQFVERWAQPTGAVASKPAQEAAKTHAKPYKQRVKRSSSLASSPTPPSETVIAAAVPAAAVPAAPTPTVSEDRLAKFQTTLVQRSPKTSDVVASDGKTLGIPSATFATAVLESSLSSDRPETMVVARLSYGVTVGNRRVLPANTKLVGRATYQERGGQWYVDVRFDRLVRPGAPELRTQAIATQRGQAGLYAVVTKKDERDQANVRNAVLDGVKKVLRDQPGADLAHPFIQDRADDSRAMRRSSVVVLVPRGTAFQAQFTQPL